MAIGVHRFLLAAFLGLFPLVSLALTPTPVEQLPSEVQKAVRVNAYIDSNALQTELGSNLSSGSLQVVLNLDHSSKYKTYQDRFKIEVNQNPTKWQLKNLKTAKTYEFVDPISKKIVSGYKGQSQFRFDVILEQATLLANDSKLELLISFQSCSERNCFLPYKVSLPLNIFAQQTTSKESTSSINGELERRMSGNQFWLILFLFVAGFLTAFTPCVYPLYPITVGIFSNWAQKQMRKQQLLVISYCVGIALSYAMLGIVAATSGKVFGSYTQRPEFFISIGIVLAISALLFSGIIQLKISGRLMNKLAHTTRSKNFNVQLGSSLFMGATLGLIAAPCVGPILLALLSWLTHELANSEGGVTKGFFYLFTYGFGLATPFYLLAIFSSQVNRVPSFVKYTPWIKKIGSILILIASIYYINQGISILSKDTVKLGDDRHLLANKMDHWSIIDFRADWCAACLDLEEQTLSHPDVISWMKKQKWQLLKVDLTIDNPENETLSKQFQIISLPAILIRHSSGKICSDFSLFKFENHTDFLKRIEKAKNNCK